MKIEAIVIHHTASRGSGDGSAEWQAICLACQRRRGPSYLCDYHYGIGPTGKLFNGQPPDKVCYHCGDDYLNEHSLAVSFIGNFQENTIQPLQFNAGVSIVRGLINKYKGVRILKHSDIVATACPGKNFPFTEFLEKVNSAPSNSLFPDVDNSAWYAQAIEKVVRMGLMKGDSEGTFRPLEPVSRGELAQVLINLLEKYRL